MSILTGAPPGDLDRKGTFDEVKNPDIAASRRFRFASAAGEYRTLPPSQSEGPQLPPRGVAPGDAPFSRIQFPPRIEKLPSSVDFRQQNFALALPAGVGSTVAGPSFTLPRDQVGWLQNNAIYVLTPTAATAFSMAILINGGPIPGFDNIQIPPGIANFVLLGDDDMRVRIPNNATVSTLFTNNSAAAWTVGGLIQGWYHPVSAEERAWGSDA